MAGIYAYAPAIAVLPFVSFLVAFIAIAVVLDAALDGAVMLAKRDEEGES